jgi:alpha-L-fucosidase
MMIPQMMIPPMMTRRDFLFRAPSALALASTAMRSVPAAFQSRPVPSPAQLEWQREELAMFLHFGMNTFTNREWGDGKEDPSLFAPSRLDAGQWARTARAAGYRAMILTAKHHDGFCLWPSKTTTHTVARSPWRGGQGDVVREFVDACRDHGLRAGLYLSPWDRNSPVYGDSPRYNDLYCDQLTELLTQYGPLSEVWFDGANGEGPNGRRQTYDWPRVWALVRKLQPNAVIFSDAGPDVRWCGNEKGIAGDPNWSTVDPLAVPFPGATGPGVTAALQNGDPAGSVWRPAEADTSIRPGWFYHAAEDGRVRTVDQLVDLYFNSVGRNSKLLLNVPPTPEGLLHPTDASRLVECHERLRGMFAVDRAAGVRVTWRRIRGRTMAAELQFGFPVNVSTIRLEEDITKGQTVTSYAFSGLDGDTWRDLSGGSTIGYARLDDFGGALLSRARLDVELLVEMREPVTIKLY